MRLITILIFSVGALSLVYWANSSETTKTASSKKQQPQQHITEPAAPKAKLTLQPYSQVPLLGELQNHPGLVKTNSANQRIILDALIAANQPMARMLPVDESLYQQPPLVMAQTLESVDERELTQRLQLAGLTPEQRQIIMDAIIKAN